MEKKNYKRDKSNTEVIAFSSVFANGCREYSSLDEVEVAQASYKPIAGSHV